MSTRPCRASTSAAQARTTSRSAMSISTYSTGSFSAAASCASVAPFCASISAQITLAPQRANSSTVALPMPDTPPVIIAVLPSSRMDRLPLRLSAAYQGEPLRRPGNAGIKPALAAVGKCEGFVEQHHVVPLRTLRLVHGEHIAEIELVVALALPPVESLDAAQKALGPH